MKTYTNLKNIGLGLIVAAVVLAASCKKNQYYVDGGLSNPNFNGNMLQYLQAKPFYFDTLATVIKLAGLEQNFQQDDMTFFAPTDHAIQRSILNVNKILYQAGKDTILRLTDISPDIWRKYLLRYMFQGSHYLKDYPQLDVTLVNLYPGQDYYSYNNTTVNIGVIYDDVNGIKYGGYRHLAISYIQNLNTPLTYSNNWIKCDISSSDIKPTNGVVHTLNDYTTFGFNTDFVTDVVATR